MKSLTVVVAGFGARLLEERKVKSLAGLTFTSHESVFPALTCPAQATLRTGLRPESHGIVLNGVWMNDLVKPLFWEQSAQIVHGPRVWESRRAAGGKVGLFFFQQSLGEAADVIISPAPIHKHGGGMIMGCAVQPMGGEGILTRLLGEFPLYRYWGPLASPRVGRRCVSWFEEATRMYDVDEAYLYLPTLDYFAQKYGPDSAADVKAFRELRGQLERLADICQKRGAQMKVIGDYEITPVTAAPVQPNVVLRREGLFKVRELRGRAYPDFYQSKAFAVCDHECCLLVGPESERAEEVLMATGNYRLPGAEAVAGKRILLAKEGSWCAYPWWTNKKEAPDYATHVDIHNKPGFDPTELFFFGRGTVKGTHGHLCRVACSEG